MDIRTRINNESIVLHADECERLRDVLYRSGYVSVRGRPMYSNLILAYEAEGAEIRTAEGLLEGR